MNFETITEGDVASDIHPLVAAQRPRVCVITTDLVREPLEYNCFIEPFVGHPSIIADFGTLALAGIKEADEVMYVGRRALQADPGHPFSAKLVRVVPSGNAPEGLTEEQLALVAKLGERHAFAIEDLKRIEAEEDERRERERLEIEENERRAAEEAARLEEERLEAGRAAAEEAAALERAHLEQERLELDERNRKAKEEGEAFVAALIDHALTAPPEEVAAAEAERKRLEGIHESEDALIENAEAHVRALEQMAHEDPGPDSDGDTVRVTPPEPDEDTRAVPIAEIEELAKKTE